MGAFGFLLAHGSSVEVAFKLRREREIERVCALLDISASLASVAYVSLLVMFAAGITLGILGDWWRQRWIWAALGLLILWLMVFKPF